MKFRVECLEIYKNHIKSQRVSGVYSFPDLVCLLYHLLGGKVLYNMKVYLPVYCILFTCSTYCSNNLADFFYCLLRYFVKCQRFQINNQLFAHYVYSFSFKSHCSVCLLLYHTSLDTSISFAYLYTLYNWPINRDNKCSRQSVSTDLQCFHWLKLLVALNKNTPANFLSYF